MGDTRGEQADRGELLCLRELVFEFHALGEVVQDHQPSNHAAFFADERRER